MRKAFAAIAMIFTAILAPHAQLTDPFKVDADLVDNEIRVRVSVPENHYLYADHFEVSDAMGNQLKAVKLPATASITDPNTGEPKPVFNQDFQAVYAWEPASSGNAAVHIQYWGCNDRVCFIPQDKVFSLGEGLQESEGAVDSVVTDEPADWQVALNDFEIKKSAWGYLKAEEFMQFLDRSGTGAVGKEVSDFELFLNDPVAFVRESGLLVTVLFILLGGLALNLTPCVLPMIPVNMAIIGAGAQAGSKGRGFALGATYGLGIALVYGILGVIVVLTGSQFGTIQANPWFNLIIALVFVVLSLAMFDVFQIDFSRFQSQLGSGPNKPGSFLLALFMGSVSALLAGACVAPVVIAVLLLSASVYEANNIAGLLLPFVLGIGMALPWPFAGAGLSFLPKPGKWMVYVKYGFATGIVFFALYYGHLSYRGFSPAKVEDGIDGRTNAGLAEALEKAQREGKPVLIDFTASWCKNCQAMEKTTFKDDAVEAKLDGYVMIRYVSEDVGNQNTKAVWEHFDVQGLPTFVVLDAKK